MSSLTYCDFYCDESLTNGSGNFYFGGLLCSPARAAILRKKLKDVKNKNGFSGHEMKWTKVSKTKLSVYKEYIQVFLDDPFSQFIMMEITRDRTWTSKLG